MFSQGDQIKYNPVNMTNNLHDERQWVTLQLVVVKYPQGDFLGLLFALYSTLVFELPCVYMTLFLRNRDLLTTYCCFTHLISEFISWYLKRYLKHPRPLSSAPTGGFLEGEYGMPSQHCHCFAYVGMMVLLLVFHYYHKQTAKRWRLFTFFSVVVAVALQVASRVYLNYHTMTQCLAGVALGMVNATIFYIIGLILLRYTANFICSQQPFKMFRFRRDLIESPPRSNDLQSLDKAPKTIKDVATKSTSKDAKDQENKDKIFNRGTVFGTGKNDKSPKYASISGKKSSSTPMRFGLFGNFNSKFRPNSSLNLSTKSTKSANNTPTKAPSVTKTLSANKSEIATKSAKSNNSIKSVKSVKSAKSPESDKDKNANDKRTKGKK